VKKSVSVAIIAGIAIIIGVIGYQLNETTWSKVSVEEYYEKDCEEGCEGVSTIVYPENPQNLYGLQINKDKYLLGENVFVKINDVPMELKTRALFFTPSGKQFYEINIDGEKSSGFKQYFKPQLLANRQLCDVNELIGQWTVMFENNPQDKLNFDMTEEYLPGHEEYFESSTCGVTRTIPLQPDYIGPED